MMAQTATAVDRVLALAIPTTGITIAFKFGPTKYGVPRASLIVLLLYYYVVLYSVCNSESVLCIVLVVPSPYYIYPYLSGLQLL